MSMEEKIVWEIGWFLIFLSFAGFVLYRIKKREDARRDN